MQTNLFNSHDAQILRNLEGRSPKDYSIKTETYATIKRKLINLFDRCGVKYIVCDKKDRVAGPHNINSLIDSEHGNVDNVFVYVISRGVTIEFNSSYNFMITLPSYSSTSKVKGVLMIARNQQIRLNYVMIEKLHDIIDFNYVKIFYHRPYNVISSIAMASKKHGIRVEANGMYRDTCGKISITFGGSNTYEFDSRSPCEFLKCKNAVELKEMITG